MSKMIVIINCNRNIAKVQYMKKVVDLGMTLDRFIKAKHAKHNEFYQTQSQDMFYLSYLSD